MLVAHGLAEVKARSEQGARLDNKALRQRRTHNVRRRVHGQK